jgi:hypothetical protein
MDVKPFEPGVVKLCQGFEQDGLQAKISEEHLRTQQLPFNLFSEVFLYLPDDPCASVLLPV